MTSKMYRVEALRGDTVVSVKPGWGVTSGDAVDGVKGQFDHIGVKYEGLRSVLANNIYHASLIDGK